MAAVHVGLDVGNGTSCVALARGNAVDVVMNGEGLRETPTAVCYDDNARAVGFQAISKFASKPKNTVLHVKRLMGLPYQASTQGPKLLYDVQPDIDAQCGACVVGVQRKGGCQKLRPVQVLATVLKDLKRTAESNARAPLGHCVLSIPCYYGQEQRWSVVAAAEVAGLRYQNTSYSLMHDLTAAALSWSVSRADLSEQKPKHVLLIDVGHSATQAMP